MLVSGVLGNGSLGVFALGAPPTLPGSPILPPPPGGGGPWTYPKTWNVGDVPTAAELNTYVRDNLKFLVPGIVVTPALSPGWGPVGSGWPPIWYMQQGTLVCVGGAIQVTQAAAIGPPSVIASGLPFPAVKQAIDAEQNNAHARIDIPAGTGQLTMTEGSVATGQILVITGAYSLI